MTCYVTWLIQGKQQEKCIVKLLCSYSFIHMGMHTWLLNPSYQSFLKCITFFSHHYISQFVYKIFEPLKSDWLLSSVSVGTFFFLYAYRKVPIVL